MARDCVECEYVECCSTERGDCILITLFRDGFCSLLCKRGLEKKKGGAGCVVCTYQRKYPSELLVASKVFIS